MRRTAFIRHNATPVVLSDPMSRTAFIGHNATPVGLAEGFDVTPFLLHQYRPGDSGTAFSRASVAYQFNVDERYEQVAAESACDAHHIAGTRHLLIQPGGTGVVTWSADISQWTIGTGVTRQNATSCILGQVGSRIIDDGSTGNTWVTKPSGVFTGAAEVGCFLVERGTGSKISIRIRNTTTNNPLYTVTITTATGVVTTTGTGSYEIRELAPLGPNEPGSAAKPLWRLIMWYTGVAGNGRQIGVYPTGVDNIEAGFSYLHYGQIFESSVPVITPVVTAAASLAQAADAISIPIAFAPQPLTLFVRGRALFNTAKLAANQVVASLGDLAAGVDSFTILKRATGLAAVAHWDGLGGGLGDAVVVGFPAGGTLVEGRAVLYTDSSKRFDLSINGAAEQTNFNAAAGALPGAFEDNVARLGAVALERLIVMTGDRSLAWLHRR